MLDPKPLLTMSSEWGLGIFAKEPRPGRVKTRLIPPLTATEAAALYQTSLVETITAMSSGPFQPTLFYDGDTTFFAERFSQLPRHPQVAGPLGERLTAAMATLFGAGCRAVALIGSDSPDLPVAFVTQAFAALAESDAVTIPARDGGYVLIGARTPLPQLFTDIPWSTAAVLAKTRTQAARLGIRWAELAEWEDIDDFPALRRLLQRSPTSETARYARTHLRHLDLDQECPGILDKRSSGLPEYPGDLHGDPDLL